MKQRNLKVDVMLLSQSEVAEMLGVSIRTLECWRWRKKGPKYIKVGRLARYKYEDVLAYIDHLAEQEVVIDIK